MRATEIAASNSGATPTVIITNSGSTGANEASPALRLTPAESGLFLPSSSPSATTPMPSPVSAPTGPTPECSRMAALP